jgi:nitroreductase
MTENPEGTGSGLMRAIKSRRSARSYSDRPVPRELIELCVEAARHAPSACNVQPSRFLVIDDPELKARLATAAFSGIYRATGFAAAAPVLVVLLSRFDWYVQGAGKQIQGTSYHLLDAGIAGEHFILRAAELGLGTCWIGWYNRRKVRRVLRIPRRYRICALISIGWPAEDDQPTAKQRREQSELLCFNSLELK